MATAAATDRLTGFRELLRVDGETVLFRETERRLSNRGSLKAVVNRGLGVTKMDKGQVHMDERADTTIEIARADVDSAPDPGESFEDSDGLFHRIRTVKRTDNTYYCECKLVEADA